MTDAFAWISDIFRALLELIPRRVIVKTTHGAVKFRNRLGLRGWKMEVVPLGPGIHFYWPITTEFEIYPTARQTTNLRPQTLVTADDKTIIAAGLVVYRIRNVEAILARTFDPDQTIEEIALGSVTAACSAKDWRSLREAHEDGSLAAELQRQVQKQLSPYGVQVLKCSLTDLAPCKVFKLVGDSKGDPTPLVA